MSWKKGWEIDSETNNDSDTESDTDIRDLFFDTQRRCHISDGYNQESSDDDEDNCLDTKEYDQLKIQQYMFPHKFSDKYNPLMVTRRSVHQGSGTNTAIQILSSNLNTRNQMCQTLFQKKNGGVDCS